MDILTLWREKINQDNIHQRPAIDRLTEDMNQNDYRVAIYALTAQGAVLAQKMAYSLSADLFLPERFKDHYQVKDTFTSLKSCLSSLFNDYQGHILVAATGLVVRLIAPLVVSKKTDPAVITMGQDGRFVISLLSGHLGRANDLARKVATITGGQAVITTATDLQNVPALEVVGADLGFKSPSLKPLALVSRRLSEGQRVKIFDPLKCLQPHLESWPELFEYIDEPITESGLKLKDIISSDSAFIEKWQHDISAQESWLNPPQSNEPTVVVDFRNFTLPSNCLVFRPPVLAVGVGCHRDCPTQELKDFIEDVLKSHNLSSQSLALLATVDSRSQPDLAPASLARAWQLPLLSYSSTELATVETPTPSETVLRRIGAASVCEASAMLATQMGTLIVHKQKGRRTTCAVALLGCRL
ncbi:MAG: cobalamin biosynthesis protein [Deltaproteobacteria bacterium]|jgi:cobalt-precorrin 5A hydrolase|nr:cobalamin biosynthesis protein [Deltaproteobacteria bacterium]